MHLVTGELFVISGNSIPGLNRNSLYGWILTVLLAGMAAIISYI